MWVSRLPFGKSSEGFHDKSAPLQWWWDIFCIYLSLCAVRLGLVSYLEWNRKHECILPWGQSVDSHCGHWQGTACLVKRPLPAGWEPVSGMTSVSRGHGLGRIFSCWVPAPPGVTRTIRTGSRMLADTSRDSWTNRGWKAQGKMGTSH